MRRKKPVTDVHHKKARSNGGTNDDSNMIVVQKSKHQSFHHLFYDGSPQKVVSIINKWIDPDFEVILVKRKQEEEELGVHGLA